MFFSRVGLVIALATPPAHAAYFDAWNGIHERDQRIEIIDSLCASLKHNYSGWELKKSVKLNDAHSSVAVGEEICLKARAQESTISDPSPNQRFEIARHNLKFADRVLKLGASFRDSHLLLMRNQARTTVRLGIRLIEIKNHFYVEAVEGQLQNFLSYAGHPTIQKGDEIILWNGRTIEEARKKLLPYVSSSSDLALRKEALSFLTMRGFAYPEEGKVEIEFVTPGTDTRKKVELPWVYGLSYVNQGNALHEDDLVYFRGIGAKSQASLTFRDAGQEVKKKVLRELTDEEEDRISLDGRVTNRVRLLDDNYDIIAQMGIYSGNILWIQLRSFSNWESPKVEPKEQKDQSTQNVQQFLENWLKLAAEKSYQVILDLRYNPGGSLGNSDSLIAALLQQNTTAVSATRALVMTESDMATVLQQFSPALGIPLASASGDRMTIEFKKAFHKQIEAEKSSRLFVSPLYSLGKIASKDIFNQAPPLLIWTGPDCVSACEYTAMTLSANHLGSIMGKPTNGTGQASWPGEFQGKNQTLIDSYNLFYGHMLPNLYFGPPVAEFASDLVLPVNSLQERIDRIAENRPVQPDVEYEETWDDLMENGKDWLKTSQKWFETKKARP